MLLLDVPISKVNTVCQIVLAAVILYDLAFTPDLAVLRTQLAWVVGILTIASSLIYANDFVKHMSGAQGPGTPSSGAHK